MCLLSQWRFPKRATKDILCYKVLNKTTYGKLYTPFRFEMVTVPMLLKAKGSSFSFKAPYVKRAGYIHAFTIEPLARIQANVYNKCVVSCIIPKGTLYHVDSTLGEICAKQMYIKEIIYNYR